MGFVYMGFVGWCWWRVHTHTFTDTNQHNQPTTITTTTTGPAQLELAVHCGRDHRRGHDGGQVGRQLAFPRCVRKRSRAGLLVCGTRPSLHTHACAHPQRESHHINHTPKTSQNRRHLRLLGHDPRRDGRGHRPPLRPGRLRPLRGCAGLIGLDLGEGSRLIPRPASHPMSHRCRGVRRETESGGSSGGGGAGGLVGWGAMCACVVAGVPTHGESAQGASRVGGVGGSGCVNTSF